MSIYMFLQGVVDYIDAEIFNIMDFITPLYLAILTSAVNNFFGLLLFILYVSRCYIDFR